MTDPDYSEARKPRPARRFTVLLPLLRPPVMLPFAIQSVLAQTETDFELCVICDGAPAESAAVAQQFADADPRVRVFAFPKGLRHGEAHRAAVLEGAQSRFVAQIGDDDLWLPNHLANLSGLLAVADFVSVPAFYVRPDRHLHFDGDGDLGLAPHRQRLLDEKWNFFGPTEAGYRLSAYRALPEGWSPAPETVWTDLHMWRKFLRQPGLRFASGIHISTLKFDTPRWHQVSLADRAAANAAVWDRLHDKALRTRLRKVAPNLIAYSIGREALWDLAPLDLGRYAPLLWRHLTRRPPGPLRVF